MTAEQFNYLCAASQESFPALAESYGFEAIPNKYQGFNVTDANGQKWLFPRLQLINNTYHIRSGMKV